MNNELEFDVNFASDNVLPEIYGRQEKQAKKHSDFLSQFELSVGKSKAYRSIGYENTLTESSFKPLKQKNLNSKLQPIKFQDMNSSQSNQQIIDQGMSCLVKDYRISQENKGRFSQLLKMLSQSEIQNEEINQTDATYQEHFLNSNKDVRNSLSDIMQSTLEKQTHSELLDYSNQINKRPQAQLQMWLPSTRIVKMTSKISQSPKISLNNAILMNGIQTPMSTYRKNGALSQRSNLSLHASIDRKQNQQFLLQRGQIQQISEFISKSPFIQKKKLQVTPTCVENVDVRGLDNYTNQRVTNQINRITLDQIDDENITSDDLEELQQTNTNLRDQLQSQIQLFEQYLQVAQHANLANFGFTHNQLILVSSEDTHLRSQSNDSELEMLKESLLQQQTSDRNQQDRQHQIIIPENPQKAWQKKVETLKEQLEIQGNIECIQTENNLKDKRQVLASLMNENMFEYSLVKNKEKMLNLETNKNIVKSIDKQTIQHVIEQRKLEELIRKETAKRDELSQWGLNNYVIQFRQKVRLMEEIIDRAQKVKAKQNEFKIYKEMPFQDNIYRRERPKYWRQFNWFQINVDPIKMMLHINSKEINDEDVLILEQRFQLLSNELKLITRMKEELIAFIKTANQGEECLRIIRLKQLREQPSLQTNNLDPKFATNMLLQEQQTEQIQQTVVLKQEPFESKWLKALAKEPQIVQNRVKDAIEIQNSYDLKQEPQQSKWLTALAKEKTQNEVLRSAHLKNLFQENSDVEDDGDDMLDHFAAKQNIEKFMQKLDNHLDLEVGLIKDWSRQQNKNLQKV